MIRTINPLKAAFKIVQVLEEEAIPHGFLDEVFETVKSLIDFIPIKHNPSDETHVSFPKTHEVKATDFALVVQGLIGDLEKTQKMIDSKLNYYERIESEDLLMDIYIKIEKIFEENKETLSSLCFESVELHLQTLVSNAFLPSCDPQQVERQAISIIRINRAVIELLKKIE